MDTNAFKGVVNVKLFEVAQKMNEEKWIFRNIKNENQNLEVTAQEFYEIKALLDIFVTDCLGG